MVPVSKIYLFLVSTMGFNTGLASSILVLFTLISSTCKEHCPNYDFKQLIKYYNIMKGGYEDIR